MVVVALPVGAVTDKEIQEARQFRQDAGFPSSIAVVQESYADPGTYSDMSRGIPLTPADAAELDRRREIVWAIGPVVEIARQRDGSAEMYGRPERRVDDRGDGRHLAGPQAPAVDGVGEDLADVGLGQTGLCRHLPVSRARSGELVGADDDRGSFLRFAA